MLSHIHVLQPGGTDSARNLRRERAVAQSALALIAGILLSGPIALLVVALVHPQPAWQDAATYARHAHWIQTLPYAGGFLLVGSCVALVATLHALAPIERRGRANLALAIAGSFAALIVLNYIVQTTFVPSLASPYRDEHAPMISALTMSNPRSLGWALEMWGYAVFGIATWLIAFVFGTSRLERATAATFVANGVMSVIGGIATAVWPGGVMTLAGGIAFAAWNALMLVMGVLVVLAMRRRLAT
jgi:hypothetical protein